jgi:putative lipoic acid-binding regulatory protein
MDSNPEPEEQANARRERLRMQLNAFHNWPSPFTFKFIMPNLPENIAQLMAIFGQEATYSHRTSQGGKYVAFTITEVVPDAESVFLRYEAASSIPGVFSL